MTFTERHDGLEATAANLRRILGEEGARALAEAFGGRRLYVPQSPGAHHPITAALGAERAHRLAAAFHGVGIDVPMLPARRQRIREMAAAGAARSAIARELRVTERWVYKVLAEPESPPAWQGTLFDTSA